MKFLACPRIQHNVPGQGSNPDHEATSSSIALSKYSGKTLRRKTVDYAEKDDFQWLMD